jgi:hypothetical protein
METMNKTKTPKLERLVLPKIEYNESINFVETKLLYLSMRNSSGRVLNGDAKSHAVFDLRSYLNFEDDPNVLYVSISLPYATLVNSNYIVNQYNNILIIVKSGVPYTYTFPYGNYAVESFITQFNSLASGDGFTISFDYTRVKFTITNTTAPFYLDGNSTIDYIVGFNDNVYSTEVAPYTATMPRICNFLPTPSYQIAVVGGTMYNGLILAPNGQVQQSNILACIPNIGKLNTQLVYRNDGQDFRLSTLSQTFLEVMILDNENRFVDFNGITTFFSIKVNIHRKSAQIKGKFSDILERAIITRTNVELDNEM